MIFKLFFKNFLLHKNIDENYQNLFFLVIVLDLKISLLSANTVYRYVMYCSKGRKRRL